MLFRIFLCIPKGKALKSLKIPLVFLWNTLAPLAVLREGIKILFVHKNDPPLPTQALKFFFVHKKRAPRRWRCLGSQPDCTLASELMPRPVPIAAPGLPPGLRQRAIALRQRVRAEARARPRGSRRGMERVAAGVRSSRRRLPL